MFTLELRRLLRWVLAWLCGACLLQAEAQQAGEAASLAADGSAVVESASSQWSREQLDAWWAALRHQNVAGRERLELPPALLPPEGAAWRPVTLPEVRHRPGAAGLADVSTYQMRWYRLRIPPGGEAPQALYLPRFVALSAAVLLRTPQGWRALLDEQPAVGEPRVQPLWLPLPGAGERGMELVVALPVPQGGYYSVSRIWAGPRDALESCWRWRERLQSGLPQAMSLTLAVLGLFGLTLWLRRPSEPIYAFFGLAAAAWIVRSWHYYAAVPASPTGQDWFWWATHASMAWIMLASLLFALRFASHRFMVLERLLAASVLGVSLLSMPLWLRSFDFVVLQYAVTAAVAAIGTASVAWLAWLERRTELSLMALALIAGVLLGSHDLALLAGWAWPEHFYLLPFASLLVTLSFLYAIQRRYVGAVELVQAENSQLHEDLEEQVSVMQAQNAQLREVERQQALLLERQRIMADMHDGLGSSLLSALVAVEQGKMSHEKVVEVLRECVDDLRLVIDSLEPVGHDLVSLLATMRYRLGKRLQTGGLKLDWDVQDLPPLPWLEPPDALHVLRLMQEALNNVLKHAQASRVRMVTRHHGSYVEIRVEDDGAGFDLQNVRHGRGLKSQIKRAQRLGGKLRIDSSPGSGTRLSLRLPVERRVEG